MNKRFFLISSLFLSVCTCSVFLLADEAFFEEDQPEPSVFVQCNGRLRHGVVAVGCETTGTTITFRRMIWELQLPDDDSREFAKRHHNEPVVVTGALRKVIGTEDMVRWIVDVNKLTEADSGSKSDEDAKVTIRGTLRAALSQTRDTPDLSIRTDDQTWQLDFASGQKTRTAAELLIGQPVLLTGNVVPLLEGSAHDEASKSSTKKPTTQTVRVKTIDAADIASDDLQIRK